MAIFTMSDLHLSLDTDKSMEVFGSLWSNYIERIYENWNSVVSDCDTVLVGGDISWAMHLEDCKKDFEFVNSLPGKKIFFKGNHDYWWESMNKMNTFLAENGFDTIAIANNNAFICEECLVTGSRLWSLPADSGFGADDEKIYLRELARLRLSMEYGETLCSGEGIIPQRRICILHYPPFSRDGVLDANVASLLKEFSVTDCFYGHLHSSSVKNAFEGEEDGIIYRLVSADYLGFMPFKI